MPDITPLRLAIMLDASYGYARDIARGAGARALELGHEAILTLPDSPRRRLTGDDFDGALVMNPDGRSCARYQSAGIQVVNISSRWEPRSVPSVLPDNAAAGALAAEHLLQRGVRSCAFNGFAAWFSRMRHEGFAAVIRAAGLPCHAAEWQTMASPKLFTDWMRRMPTPVGLLAVNDQLAFKLLALARRAGVAVPDDLAIVGIDNDDIYCELTAPRLTSVDLDGRRIGRTAIDLLCKLCRGEPAPDSPILVTPAGIVARASSDAVAVLEPGLAKALAFIRSRALQPISVQDILTATPMSRRTLERRLRAAIGRTPKQEILRLRLEHARHLLVTSTMPIRQVARRCGHATPQHFVIGFRRHFGMNPAAYRAWLARGLVRA